jgi:hypothetical protein
MKTLCLRLFVFTITFLFFYSGSSVSVFGQQQENKENIRFLWAFGATVKEEEKQRSFSITKDIALKSGDKIKIFLELKEKCFVYVIYHSPQGEILTLFPHRFELLDDHSFASSGYFIPKGDGWFELDDHLGEERFYLLASSERLGGLETLINQYESTDLSKKSEISTQILDEIRRLRWQHRNFKSFAEKPPNIIGQVRGTDTLEKGSYPDVSQFAVEISAKKFYSKAFTIDHR